VICALLFFAMVFNYVDRQMNRRPEADPAEGVRLERDCLRRHRLLLPGAYALSYLFFGRFVDWVGAKAGYAVAFVIWTIGHMSHAAVRTVSGFILARIVLGVGEGGGFPAGIKAVAEWFPKRERALATGIFNAGTKRRGHRHAADSCR